LNCGAPQPDWGTADQADPLLDFNQELASQLTELFFMALKQRVDREHQPDKLTDYAERLYGSGFRDIVARRFALQADRFQQLQELGMVSSSAINQQIEDLFDELLDYFIIRYCKDITEIALPEAILKYQQTIREEANLFQVMVDYLDFSTEKERVYTDLLKIPMDKLKNASQSYLFPARDEKIILLADQSLLGNGKEGFALTDRSLYWRAPFQKPRIVAFANLAEFRRTEDWITINGFFFNAGLSLNLKMLRLLGKLKQWFR
jgi:hypothetical protein